MPESPYRPVQRPSDCWPAELLNEYRRLAKLPHPPVKMEQGDNDDTFRCSRACDSFVFKLCHTGSDYAGILAAIEWLKHGPKIVNVTEEQWQALSHVEVRLGVSDFSMPYPSILVNMPAGKLHRYILLNRNEFITATGPVPVLIGCSVSHDNLHDIVTTVRSNPEKLIEESLQKFHGDVSEEEGEAALLSLRVACNIALAMANYGCLAEYLFPKEVAAEKKYIAKGDRAGRGGRTASDRLHEQPMILSLDRSVKLYHRKSITSHGEVTTGREMPFHWRRGHWHMVRCGVGKAERRRVLYPPTMIRADLFNGDIGDTTTIYT